MKILITGSTGFLGRHLVFRLLELSHQVTIFVRDKAKAYALFGDSVHYSVGNFSEEEKISVSLSGIDIVYHLAGKLGEWGVSQQEYDQVNFEFTKIILKKSINSKIKQFIFCSSGGVYGPLEPSETAHESTPFNPSNFYENSKAKADQFVNLRKTEINITILRPEFVFGEFDTHVLGLFKQINRSFFPCFGSGKTYLHPTYIKDVIAAFTMVLNNAACFGESYNIAGKKPVIVKELVEIIGKLLGKKIVIIYIPKFLGLWLASLIELFAKVFNTKPLLTRSMVKYFSENRNYPSNKIQDQGLKLTDLEDGLKNTILYYKENNLL